MQSEGNPNPHSKQHVATGPSAPAPPPSNNVMFSDPFISFPTSNINTPLTSARHVPPPNINHATFALASPSPPTPARLTPAKLSFNPDDFLISPPHLHQPSTPTHTEPIGHSQRGTPELKRRLFGAPDADPENDAKDIIMSADPPRDRNPLIGSTSTPLSLQKKDASVNPLAIAPSSVQMPKPLQFPSQSPSASPIIPFPFSPQNNYLSERSPSNNHNHSHPTHNNASNNLSLIDNILDTLPSSSPLATLPLQAQPNSSPPLASHSLSLPLAPTSPPAFAPPEFNNPSKVTVKFQPTSQPSAHPQSSSELNQNSKKSLNPLALFKQLPPSLQPNTDISNLTKLDPLSKNAEKGSDAKAEETQTPKSDFRTPKMASVCKSSSLQSEVNGTENNAMGNISDNVLATDPTKVKMSSALLSTRKPSSATKTKQTPSALITASGTQVPTTPFTPDPTTPAPTPPNPSSVLISAKKVSSSVSSASTSGAVNQPVPTRKLLEPTSSGLTQSNNANNRKPLASKFKCSCKASRCLKLYCLCFANSAYCSDACSCKNCFNTADTVKAVHDARDAVLARDPRAFDPKVRFGLRPGLPLGAATTTSTVPPVVSHPGAMVSPVGVGTPRPIGMPVNTPSVAKAPDARRSIPPNMLPLNPAPLAGTPAPSAALAHAQAIALGHVTPGPGDIHSKGCNCRKGCSKKYCVCRELRVECGPRCTCSGPNGCENRSCATRHIHKSGSLPVLKSKNGAHGPPTASHPFLQLSVHRHLQGTPTPPTGYTEIIADQLKGQRGKSKALKLLNARSLAEKKRARGSVTVSNVPVAGASFVKDTGGNSLRNDVKDEGIVNGKDAPKSGDKSAAEPMESGQGKATSISIRMEPLTEAATRNLQQGWSSLSVSTGDCTSPTVKRLKLGPDAGNGGGSSDSKGSTSVPQRTGLDVASKELKITEKSQATSDNHLFSGLVGLSNEKESTRMAVKVNREILDRVLASDGDNSENVGITTDICEARRGVKREHLVELNGDFSGYDNSMENKRDRSNESNGQAKQTEINQGDGNRTQMASEVPVFGRQSAAIEVCRLPRILRVKMGSGRLYNSKL